MAERIQVTKDMLHKLNIAQLEHTNRMIADALSHGYSDDGFDYLKAALDISGLLLSLDFDQNVDMLDELLNNYNGGDCEYSLSDFACDGICSDIYDLNCIALDDEEIR